jgi:four helix bundle protein
MEKRDCIVRSYKDLRVWELAIDLSVLVYEATKTFPREEIYGLTSQMRRAAVSIASNIAEGNARQSPGVFLQFLGMARGSLAELNTQITIASKLGLLNRTTEARMLESLDSLGRLLNALRNSIVRKAEKRPPSFPTPNP